MPMQSVTLYDERDSASAMRVVVDPESESQRGGANTTTPAWRGARQLHMSAGVVHLAEAQAQLHFWTDTSGREAHMLLLDAALGNHPVRQLSLCFPEPSVGCGVSVLAVDPKQLALVWVCEGGELYLCYCEAQRRENGTLELSFKRCVRAQLGAANSSVVSACVLEAAVSHGFVASVVYTDGDEVWAANVSASDDVEEERWIPRDGERGGGSGDGGQQQTGGWLASAIGTAASGSGRAKATRRIARLSICQPPRPSDAGGCDLVLFHDDASVAFYPLSCWTLKGRGSTAPSLRKSVHLPAGRTSSAHADCGGGVVVVVATGAPQNRQSPERFVHVLDGSGAVRSFAPPHSSAHLISFSTVAADGSAVLLWSVERGFTAAPISIAALCSLSADDTETVYLVQTIGPTGRRPELQGLHALSRPGAQRVAAQCGATLVFSAVGGFNAHSAAAPSGGVAAARLAVDALVPARGVDVVLQARIGADEWGGGAAGSGRLLCGPVAIDVLRTGLPEHVPRAISVGLQIVASVDGGFSIFSALLTEAATTGPRALTLAGFAALRAACEWAGLIGDSAIDVSAEEVEEAILYALANFGGDRDGDGEGCVEPQLRRFVAGAVAASMTSRLAALMAAHVAWTCADSNFAASAAYERLSLSVEVVVAALRTASALGSAVTALAPAAVGMEGEGRASRTPAIVRRLLCDAHLSRRSDRVGGEGTPPLLLRVVELAVELVTLNTPQAIRACEVWCAAWGERFGVVRFFRAIALLTRGRVSGAASTLIRAHAHAAAAHLATCAPAEQSGVLVMLVTCTVRDARGEERDARLGASTLEFVRLHPHYAPLLLQALLLRRIVARVDASLVVSLVAREALDPSFVAELEILRDAVKQESSRVPGLAGFVNALASDVAMFLARAAVDDLDFTGAIRRLSDVITSDDRPDAATHLRAGIFHSVQALVAAAISSGHAADLGKIRFSNPALAEMIVAEMFSQVLNPRAAAAADRLQRESLRVANAMALYRFLMERHAFGSAARVAYEAGTTLRSSSQCTPQTLSRAVSMLALAASTIRAIPAVAVPRGLASGGEAGDGGGLDNEVSSAFPSGGGIGSSGGIAGASPDGSLAHRHRQPRAITPCAASDLPTIERQLAQTRCERTLQQRLQRPVERARWASDSNDSSGAKAVVRELLLARLWDDALSLSKAWALPLSPVLRCFALDTIAHADDGGREWRHLEEVLRRESTPQNNYIYTREVLAALINHRDFRAIPETLKDLLRRVDPAAFIHCCLQQHSSSGETQVKESVAADALETGLAYLRVEAEVANALAVVKAPSPGQFDAELQASLVQSGFHRFAVVGPATMDRLLHLAQGIVGRFQRTKGAGVAVPTFRAAAELLEEHRRLSLARPEVQQRQ